MPQNPSPLTGMQDFENTFPARRKNKASAGVSKIASLSVPVSRNKVAFQKLDFPVSTRREKSLNKGRLFQLNRKLVSDSGNEEIFKNTFILAEKTASIYRNI